MALGPSRSIEPTDGGEWVISDGEAIMAAIPKDIVEKVTHTHTTAIAHTAPGNVRTPTPTFLCVIGAVLSPRCALRNLLSDPIDDRVQPLAGAGTPLTPWVRGPVGSRTPLPLALTPSPLPLQGQHRAVEGGCGGVPDTLGLPMELGPPRHRRSVLLSEC